jgi:pilus assembly protein TadC
MTAALVLLLLGGPAIGRRLAAALRARRGRSRRPAGDVLELGRLLLLALSAGLPTAAAFSLAAGRLGGPVAGEVDDLLRRARARGLAAALADTAGPLGELASRLARAHLSGASVQQAVEAFLHVRLADERARRLERARSLPVKLIVPVSLLLLPGFVLLVFGPTFLDQIVGLLDPLGRP